MSADSHSRTAQSLSRRSLAFTVLLLGLTTALAADMMRRRASDPLAPRIAPAGWELTFRPPRSYLRGKSAPTFPNTELWVFLRPSMDGKGPILMFWRIGKPPTDSPLAICMSLLAEFDAITPRQRQAPIPPSRGTQLGPLDAVERLNQQRTAVVRAAIAESGTAYAVVMLSNATAVVDRDGELYRLFELTCRSIELSVSRRR